MLGLSLGLLLIALVTALIGLGEGPGTATRISNAAFALSVVLVVWSLINRYRRRQQDVAGREPDR
jgi:uncharacterized membrane protein YtjA (UPF0391 family)